MRSNDRPRHPLRRDAVARWAGRQAPREPIAWADAVGKGFIFGVAPVAGLAFLNWTEPLGVVGYFQALPYRDWPLEVAIGLIAWYFWTAVCIMLLELAWALVVSVALIVLEVRS